MHQSGARVIEEFLSVEGLLELYTTALLNIHPPLYDAFGMSVVEAGAFGCPTFLHHHHADAGNHQSRDGGDGRHGAAGGTHSDDVGGVGGGGVGGGDGGGGSSSSGGVGATALLRPEHGESIGVDLGADILTVASALMTALDDREALERVGAAARARALGWDELGNARAIADVVDRVLAQQHE